jgi:hypothetical protein
VRNTDGNTDDTTIKDEWKNLLDQCGEAEARIKRSYDLIIGLCKLSTSWSTRLSVNAEDGP